VATANMLGGVRDRETPFLMRMYLIYSKGAWLLASLHKELGDKQFLTFLRTLQGKYAWRHVTTKDVTAVLKEVTGRDYAAWFDQHYWGTGMPK
jgi:aminopeptidase N